MAKGKTRRMTLSVYHLLVLLGTILFCLGLKYILAKPFYKLSVRSVRQLDIIMDNATDEDEKDVLILKNLLGLLKMFFLVFFLMIFIIFLATIPVLIYKWIKPDLVVDTSSMYFYGSMFVGSFVILFLKDKADYSYWSKLLHTIILDNYNVGKYLFKKDKKKLKNQSTGKDEEFVIVSGLARAGTTALARMIYTPEIFHSTKYANMPFILAPKFWKRFYNPKNAKEKKRAHGDNVMHSETSIEAMEEYFFKSHLNDHYIKGESLLKHDIDSSTYDEYLKFQALFAENEKETRFLVKNNNLILRLESLRQYNKQFKVILMFRNPVDHAKSLLNQHLNFIKQQKEDPFTLKYMDWLGHHEFGLHQKYFDLNGGVDFSKYDKTMLSYWLLSWLNYYEHLLTLLPDDNIILVEYQDLLSSPNPLKEALASKLGVALGKDKIAAFNAAKYSNATPEEGMNLDVVYQDRIKEVFAKLQDKKLAIDAG